MRPTYGTLGPMCSPARAALIEPGQGSTHGRGSPVDDERTPASEPDRTPVSTEHHRGRAAAFLRCGGGQELSDAATAIGPA